MHATRWWQLDDERWLDEVVERLVAGVVAGDEGDAGAAATACVTEVEPVDADRLVAETFGPGTVRAHEVRVQQSVAEVTGHLVLRVTVLVARGFGREDSGIP